MSRRRRAGTKALARAYEDVQGEANLDSQAVVGIG
jgi:hypothetical protein